MALRSAGRRLAPASSSVFLRLSVLGSHVTPTIRQHEHREDQGPSSRLAIFGAAAACSASVAAFSSSSAEAAEKTALNPKEFLKFKLKEVHPVNHNTRVYRFETDPDATLGLTVASCLVTKAPIGSVGEDGKPRPVIRPYTPITPPGVKGYFDLLIKVYPEGKMSQHIDSLRLGDTLEIKGPIPKLAYAPNMKRHIGMVAGGTGITPMLQVIDAIVSNPADDTQVSLVFANLSPADVLLKEKLDALASAHPNFNVFYLVDRASPSGSWQGGVGYVNADVLRKALPPPSPDSMVLVCGPPGMMKAVSGDKAQDKSQGQLQGFLKDLGYSEEQVYKF